MNYLFKPWFRVFLGCLMISVATIYAVSLGQPRVVLQAGFIFDAYILLIFVLGFSYALRTGFEHQIFKIFIGLVICFIAYSIYWYLLSQNKVLFEYFRTMRLFVNIIAFCLLVNWIKSRPNQDNLKDFDFFFVFIITLFLLSYVFRFFVLRNPRPWLFSENNFEIAMLVVLISIYHFNLKQTKSLKVKREGLTALTVLLSFSKSGIIGYALSLLIRYKPNTVQKFIIYLVFAIFVLAILTIVISSRLDDRGIESVDRFIFMKVFWSEYTNGNPLQMLFGYGPAHNLSNMACSKLSFWVASMFKGKAYCNAAVFHSLLLKIVYEFGILFTAYFLYLWFTLLKLSYGKKLGIVIFAVLLSASISISGFSNGIVLWSLFFLIPLSKQISKLKEYSND